MHAPPFVRWHAVACSSFSAKCATTRSAIIADKDGQPLALRLCVHPCCRTTRAGMLLAAVTDCARRPTARCAQLLSAPCALRLCLFVCFITCAGMPICRSRCPPPSMHAQRSSCQPSALRLCVHACMHAPVLACSLLRSSSLPRTYLLGCAWRTSAFTRALDDFQGLSKACLPLHMTTTYDVLNV